jgi:uncharacterized cupredoxin-like copper-binding protein
MDGQERPSLTPEGEYECGSIVTFRHDISISSGAAGGEHALQLNWLFQQESTSGQGVGYRAYIDGSAEITGTGSPTVVDESSTFPTTLNQSGRVVIDVDGLIAGGLYVVEFDVRIGCNPPYKLTGNVQASFDGGTSNPGTDFEDKFGGGNQTIPMFLNAFEADLTIRKVVEGTTSSQSFPFELQTGESLPDEFSLMHNQTKAYTGSTALFPGTYTVTELVPENWDLTGISCTGTGDSVVDLDQDLVSVTLAAEDSLTCTFTNREAPGSITIVKDTLPANSSQSFTFTKGGDFPAGTFNLTGQSAGDANTEIFSGLAAGTYTIAETIPAGWKLTGRSCTGGTTNNITDGVSIDLAPGQSVTCTFTNTQDGSITIVKDTLPANSSQSFTFTKGGDFPAGTFNLTGQSAGDANTEIFSGLAAGTYTIAETIPAGWKLTGRSCTGGTTNNITDGVSIDLAPGQSVTCTFTNTQDGSITIVKDTLPANSSQSFTFTKGGDFPAGTFNLTGQSAGDANTEIFSGLAAGTYTIAETIPAGWKLTGRSCTGGTTNNITDGVSIDLAPGQSVTCTFTNTQDGSITIVKDTLPANSSQSFTFTKGGDFPAGTFNLTGQSAGDANTEIFSGLAAGTYTIAETIPAGWKLTGRSCTGGTTNNITDGVSIDLAPGQSVTCTFTNTQDGSITIVKNTEPAGSTQLFTFDKSGDFSGDFQLSGVTTDDANREVISGLTPGKTYTITETLPSGWKLTNLVCTEADGIMTSLANRSASITLVPGEEVTCTFTNTQDATLTIVKLTQPADSTQLFTFTKGGDFSGTFQRSGVTADNFNREVISGLSAGSYSIAETVPSGWSLDSIECIGGATATRSGSTITIPLGAGDDAVCTFTNRLLPPPPVPGLNLEKSVSIAGGPWIDADTAPGPTAIVGQQVRFRFVMTNTGARSLSPVNVTDNVYSTSSCTWPASLTPGASAECIIGPFAATAGQHTNIATATAGGLTATDPANYFGEGPGIQVVKTADTDEAQVGDVVTYTYVVTNTGNVTLSNVMLDDDIIGTIDAPAEGLTLDPGESTPSPRPTSITEADAAAGSVTNIATASGQPPTGPPVTDTDEVTVGVVAVLPGVLDIDIQKVAQVPLDAEGNKVVIYKEGETTTVDYLYTVTNTGTVTLVNVAVEDDILGPVTLLKTTLEPGESTTGTATHVVTAADADEGEIVNVAVVTSRTEDGGSGPTADVTETVGVTEVLDVVVTQPPAPVLPRTGADANQLFNLGLLMAAMGAAALLFTPRRRREQ